MHSEREKHSSNTESGDPFILSSKVVLTIRSPLSSFYGVITGHYPTSSFLLYLLVLYKKMTTQMYKFR